MVSSQYLDLTGFVQALAARLPGRWHADGHPTPLAQDPAADRLWDPGPLAYTAFRAAQSQRSVLTSTSGLQLCVTQHPSRRDQFVVAPLLPAGTAHVHTVGVTAPKGITVPADPARAASLVRRRQLFDYRIASMKAQTNASPGPHMPVDIALDHDGRPRVTTVHARALNELLGKDGFHLDPASGQCHLPRTLSIVDVVQRTQQAAQRLNQLGFSPTVRAADHPASSPYEPQGPASSATATPPSGPATRPRAPR